MDLTKEYLNHLTYQIIGCCINVHKELGPGLLESVYHRCLIEEFKEKKLRFTSQILVPIHYRGVQIDGQLRADFLVENSIILELKAVDALAPIYDAQILTYMKLLNIPKGILVNFNCMNIFNEGQKTLVNELYRSLPQNNQSAR